MRRRSPHLRLQPRSLAVAGFFNKSDLKAKYSVASETLGSGNFAVVKKATKTAKNSNAAVPAEVAIKFIDKSKVEDMNDIQREIEIMQMIEHKHVIKLYEIYDEPKKMNLVMELVTGGELFDRIVARGNYTEKVAQPPWPSPWPWPWPWP